MSWCSSRVVEWNLNQKKFLPFSKPLFQLYKHKIEPHKRLTWPFKVSVLVILRFSEISNCLHSFDFSIFFCGEFTRSLSTKSIKRRTDILDSETRILSIQFDYHTKWVYYLFIILTWVLREGRREVGVFVFFVVAWRKFEGARAGSNEDLNKALIF